MYTNEHPGERSVRFLADFMLGRLGRWLRILGYDASYLGDVPDAIQLRVARSEGRILLTRDRDLARRAAEAGFLVEAEDGAAQLREVITAFGLRPRRERLLTRCLDCNLETESVSREEVRDEVPPFVFASLRRFARCPGCRRVFWRATHAASILERLEAQGIAFAD